MLADTVVLGSGLGLILLIIRADPAVPPLSRIGLVFLAVLVAALLAATGAVLMAILPH